MSPSWPPETIHITPVTPSVPSADPGQLNSGYLRFWLPVIGPTATLAYRHMLDLTGNGKHPASIDLDDLATDLGIGRRGGKNAPTPKALNRLITFKLAEPRELDGSSINLLTQVPLLTTRHLHRLRPDMARAERLYREHVDPAATRRTPRPRPTRPNVSPLRRAAGHDSPTSRSNRLGR